MDWGKYKRVRLLGHRMKLYEYVLEKRKHMVAIGNYQFEFCQRRSTAVAMFMLRMLQEKYSQKDLVWKVIEWALRRKGIPERIVK